MPEALNTKSKVEPNLLAFRLLGLAWTTVRWPGIDSLTLFAGWARGAACWGSSTAPAPGRRRRPRRGGRKRGRRSWGTASRSVSPPSSTSSASSSVYESSDELSSAASWHILKRGPEKPPQPGWKKFRKTFSFLVRVRNWAETISETASVQVEIRDGQKMNSSSTAAMILHHFFDRALNPCRPLYYINSQLVLSQLLKKAFYSRCFDDL